MFWNLFANENTKNFRRSLLWVELALLAVGVLLINGMLFAMFQLNLGNEAGSAEARSQLQETLVWPGGLVNALGLTGPNFLGGLLLVVFAGSVAAQEYSWRTLHLSLSRGTPRPLLLAARFAGLLLPGLLIVLTALLTGGLLTALFSLQLTGELPLAQVDFAQLFFSLLRTAFTLLPYAALTFLLAVASRSVVVAVGGGLAYALLIEGLLMQLFTMMGGRLGEIGRYLPAGLASSLTSLNQSVARLAAGAAGSPLQTSGLAPLPAAAGITLWTLFLFGLALFIFQRQDLAD